MLAAGRAQGPALPMGTFNRYRTASFGFGFGMTPAVKALLIANTALFLITGFVGYPLERHFLLGLTPALVLKGMVWQLLTYMFFHAGLGHILFNMLALWMFGTALEQSWGQRRFLRYYLVCGVGAGIVIVLAALVVRTPQALLTTTIGASGSLFGLFVAFGIMFPNAPVLVFLLFPMPAKYFAILMGAINLYMARAGSDSGISYIGHLGGLVVGYLYLKLSFGHSGYSRRRLTFLSWDHWRQSFERWRRQRLRKKFEVYMRKHGETRDQDHEPWIQ